MLRRIVISGLVTALALITTACAGEGGSGSTAGTTQETTAPTTGPDTTTSSSTEPIKIGVLMGFTGDYAAFTEREYPAVEVAAEEINAAGGILGREIELVPVDDGSTSEGAVSGWTQLVEVDGVVAVMSMVSDSAVSLLDESAEAQVLIMCPACGTPTLDTEGGDYVWRMTSGDSDLGIVLAQIALDKSNEMSVLTEQGLEATELITEVLISAVGKGGGEIVADVRFSGDALTFQAELDEAFSQTNTVVLSTGLEAGTRLMTEYQRRGYDGVFIAIPELLSAEFASIGDGLLNEKAYGAAPAYEEDAPAYISFAERLLAKTGENPSPAYYEPNYYDQLIVTALAAVAAGEVDITGQGIRDHLVEVANDPGTAVYTYAEGVAALEAGDDINYIGPSGPIEFNDFGSVSSLYAELVVRDGDWVQERIVELDQSLK